MPRPARPIPRDRSHYIPCPPPPPLHCTPLLFLAHTITHLQLQLPRALTLQILPSAKRHQRSDKEESVKSSARIGGCLTGDVGGAAGPGSGSLGLGVGRLPLELADKKLLENVTGFVGVADIL